ncbi:hypothetical protein GW17_00049890 [Ensete ventricosum]|nr:hypothetical protein GW17_00049890 [Ensete ventricosum]
MQGVVIHKSYCSRSASPPISICACVAISRFRQRRRRQRQRRTALGPAGGAGGAADEPRLDALRVEPVVAGRQNVDAVALRQLRKADGALRRARHRRRPHGEHHGPREELLRRGRCRPGLVQVGGRPGEVAAAQEAEGGVEGEGDRRGAHEHDEDAGHVGVEVLGARVRPPVVRRRWWGKRRRRKSGGGAAAAVLHRRRHGGLERDE